MSHVMPIDSIPDWEQRLARQDAFWDGVIIDRPVVSITLPRPGPPHPRPQPRTWASPRERWFDSAYVAECALANVRNALYLGDALPTANPNLGPEVFSAFFGTELEFGESTSWSIPNLTDWDRVDDLQFSRDNAYWRGIQDLTDALLAAGKNAFYTGITDLHPGADAITAFRDPINLNLDMIDRPDDVKALLARVTDVYFDVFDAFYNKLTAAGQATTCWAGIVSTRKWYVPSNDFSCMVSKAMFDDIFLPGIQAECQHMEANLYHLDGPQALRHLDSLLEIPELNAIQWVYGAGNGRASDWMDVYHRCQAAGKGLQLGLHVDELDYFMQELHPEGLFIGLGGVQNEDHAAELLRKIARWPRR